MNQITKLLQQAQALFASMTPQSRVLAILMLCVTTASAGFLVQGYRNGTGAMEYLFDGQAFSDAELDRIELAFSSAKLRGWDRNGNRIRVPTSTRDEYLRAIATGKAFPNRLGGEMADALTGNNFLDSVRMTEMKIKDGKLRSLASALERLPNVDQVHVDYDEGKEGFATAREKRAIVCILPSGNASVPEETKRNILLLVKNFISGIKDSNIAVMDLRSGETLVGSDDPSVNQQDRFYKAKKMYESDIHRKVETLLSDYGNIRIAVNVELDNTLTEETQKLNIDEKPTVLQYQSTRKDSDSQKIAGGGRPGTEPNATGTANRSASLSSDQNSKSKESTESQRNLAGNTLTRTEKAGLQVKGSFVSISIPFSYYRKLWAMANPTKSVDDAPPFNSQDWTPLRSETEKSVQNKVVAILQRGRPGEDEFPRVAVDLYPDMPQEKIAAPSVTENTFTWLTHSWQTLALFGLAFTALVSLRSFVRNTPAGNKDEAFERGFDLPLDDADDIDLSSLSDSEEETLAPRNEDSGDILRLKTTGGDLKKDLTSIVRENPEAAATLLRNWISESDDGN